MKYSNNCGIFKTNYNLLNIKYLESYIYIYNCLIFNKLHNFLVFGGISDDVAAARRAWALPCVPGIQGFKILRFKYLRFKDLRFKDSRIPAVKKFKIVQKSKQPIAKSQRPAAKSQKLRERQQINSQKNQKVQKVQNRSKV